MRLFALALVGLAGGWSSGARLEGADVIPNDNRTPGGTVRGGIMELHLVAGAARWRPDLDVDTMVTVQAFSEEGSAPRIPGPLLRTTEGTEVRVSVRNDLSRLLVVYGLRSGAFAQDSVHIQPGSTRELRFRAGTPGTYLYWGTTTASPIVDRPWRDGQLTGAIVIDPAGTRPDTSERIFVTTVLDVLPDDSIRNPAKDDAFEMAVNGRSWPHTERLEYAVGDTVRWRWINGSYLLHPMHLHGFHFRVLAKGRGNIDSTYAPDAVRLAVTETMLSGSTFRMDWVPTRAGTWLMHCHMIAHTTPFPVRPDSIRHQSHDGLQHALTAMAGLVLGITTVDRAGGVDRPPAPSRQLRLYAQQAPGDSARPGAMGYVLQGGAAPATDSVEVPGTPLLLTRGETTAITVVNRLTEPTTVHWHGMELRSVYDGVAGWSRTGSSLAPLIAPGDSFTVALTPPRAGTFIYHTHMDESYQLGAGMYGPLLVLEPNQPFDPATDLVFMIGSIVEGGKPANSLNGRSQPAARNLLVGTRYRLRFVNILPVEEARVQVAVDSVPVTWRPVAKDGADLPAPLRVEVPARLRFGSGETYDFEWTPDRAMDAILQVRIGGMMLRQVLSVKN